MKLTIERDAGRSDGLATMGVMFLDGLQYCFTMEPGRQDPDRPKGPIPAGLYNVHLLPSPHFNGELLPHISNQPDKVTLIQSGITFEYVMIHAGNYPRDTEGCVLVGESSGKDILNSSVAALTTLISKVSLALAEGPVYAEFIG